MCDFISWVGKDGGVFFLTDKEVFSEEGREKLKGCNHNDYIGHGAIRAYWGIKGGRDKEERNFWEITEPKEIKDAIANFDDNFAGMWREGYLTNEDLRYIIYNAPEAWKVKASEQLLSQKPTNEDLRYIIYNAPEEWAAKAWEQLLSQKPTHEDLRCIIYNAPEEWAAKARKLLSE